VVELNQGGDDADVKREGLYLFLGWGLGWGW